MTRGPKKHLKRISTPKHWMLDKLTGIYAPRTSPGPHKLRECLPLLILLRNRLKYALSGREVMMIVKDKAGNIKIDNHIRRDPKFPCGFMDVVNIDKTGEFFRLLYDVKGRFTLTPIQAEEAKYKLCKVRRKGLGENKIPYITTHDGRTLRFPHPEIIINDTIKLNLENGQIESWIKFENGNTVMATGGNNIGRIGVISHIERHPGSFDIVHVRDARGHTFATRISNIFAIGKGKTYWVTIPHDKGVKLNIIEEKEKKGH